MLPARTHGNQLSDLSRLTVFGTIPWNKPIRSFLFLEMRINSGRPQK